MFGPLHLMNHPRLSRSFGLSDPDIDHLDYVLLLGISNQENFVLLDHVIDFLMGGQLLFLSACVLMILTSAVSSTCLVTWYFPPDSLHRHLEEFRLLHFHIFVCDFGSKEPVSGY